MITMNDLTVSWKLTMETSAFEKLATAALELKPLRVVASAPFPSVEKEK